MASGETTLSITELPFWYSLINILYIWNTGNVAIENITDKLVIVGLIAGFIGTFFVFWHPIQWIIEKLAWKKRNSYSIYRVESNQTQPTFHNILILDLYLRLSLKTSAINHYKNKIASQIYFLVILITIFTALGNSDFQKVTKLKDTIYLLPTQVVIFCMIFGLCYLIYKMRQYFIENIRLHAMYYFITDQLELYQNVDFIKQAIDLHDWTTTKETIYRTLLRHWSELTKFSKKEEV
jgi:hypothetical protein